MPARLSDFPDLVAICRSFYITRLWWIEHREMQLFTNRQGIPFIEEASVHQDIPSEHIHPEQQPRKMITDNVAILITTKPAGNSGI
jgi:hypothetical protein